MEYSGYCYSAVFKEVNRLKLDVGSLTGIKKKDNGIPIQEIQNHIHIYSDVSKEFSTRNGYL